jgi:hypothetical protein
MVRDMGGAFAAAVAGNEIVNVRKGHHQGDPSELTINCPDKVGLGCDFARIVFEFGLSVVKGGKQAEPSQVFSFLKHKTKKKYIENSTVIENSFCSSTSTYVKKKKLTLQLGKYSARNCWSCASPDVM